MTTLADPDETSIAGSWPFPDWHGEARRKAAEHQARRERVRALRAEFAEARAAGLKLRHANKLAAIRRRETTTEESG